MPVSAQRHSRPLALVALAWLMAASGVVRLRPASDPFAALPPDPTGDAEDAEVRAVFGPDRVVTLLLLRDAGVFAPEPLRALAALAQDLQAQPWVATVESLATTPAIRPDDQGDLRAVPLFASVPDDPAALTAGKEAALADPFFRGLLVSPDGKATALLVTLADWTVPGRLPPRLEERLARGGVEEGVASRLGGAMVQARLDGIRARALDPAAPAPEVVVARALEREAQADPQGRALVEEARSLARVDVETQEEQALAFLRTRVAEPTFAAAFDGSHVLGAGPIRDATVAAYRGAFRGAVWAALVLAGLGAALAGRWRGAVLASAAAGLGAALATAGALGWAESPIDPEAVGALGVAAALGASAVAVRATGAGPLGARAPLGGAIGIAVAGIYLLLQQGPGIHARGQGLVLAALLGALPAAVLPGAAAATPPWSPMRRRFLVAGALAFLLLFFGTRAASPQGPTVLGPLPRDADVRAGYDAAAASLPGALAFEVRVSPPPGSGEAPLQDPEVLARFEAAETAAGAVPGVVAVIGPAMAVRQVHAAAAGAPGLPPTREALAQELMLFGSDRMLRPFLSPGFDRARLLVRTDDRGAGTAHDQAVEVLKAVRGALGEGWRVEAGGDLVRAARAHAHSAGAGLMAAVVAALSAAGGALVVGMARRHPIRGVLGSFAPHVALVASAGGLLWTDVRFTGLSQMGSFVAVLAAGTIAWAWAAGARGAGTASALCALWVALAFGIGGFAVEPVRGFGLAPALALGVLLLLLWGVGDAGRALPRQGAVQGKGTSS